MLLYEDGNLKKAHPGTKEHPDITSQAEETITYIGLGSNLGNRVRFLEQGLRRLEYAGRVVQKSPIYETEPVGVPDEQPKFLNQVCLLRTLMDPDELLGLLHRIELEMGRNRDLVLQPRELDLDLLLYGDAVIRSNNLVVPHPNLNTRAFVLVPLSVIAPTLVIPGSNLTVSDLVETIDLTSVQLFLTEAN